MSDLSSLLGGMLQSYMNNVPQHPNDVSNTPHDQVVNHYQQFAQQAPPQQVYNANQQYYQQLPQNQKESLFSSLVGALTQHGVSPSQAGAQGNNPSSNNYAQLVQYVSQNPDLLQKVFGNNGTLNSPIAKMILAGALSIAAQKLTSGKTGI